ncbi:Glycosyl transferase family 2 [[Clostridium] aminophilum]|uniref:Glycosyl transferase family 2 n=1 Tax=[Clostridium] aminophilum TaxID=1526 RepID=A0A1I0CAN0_9FIRM|nr:glycosyltransferase family 2 protein [[Clostridium] aminophilum]SET16450.1 Glycosyl transferase family 2 [[Clostridium] aminophilum]
MFRYIHEAVDSLLAQTYSDLEIILVDDGSGDICDEYTKKGRRISVIHQSNRGQSAARNAGLDCCRRDMIAFLGPDDALCANTFSVMAEAMKMSGADIVE